MQWLNAELLVLNKVKFGSDVVFQKSIGQIYKRTVQCSCTERETERKDEAASRGG